MRALALGGLGAVLVACGGDEPPLPQASRLDAGGPPMAAQAGPLIDQLQWRAYAAQRDPLRAHQPEEVRCDPPAWRAELDRLEVSTAECNYALLEHPAQLDVPAGSTLQLRLFYFDLTAPEPAQAHLAILFDDALQWETFLDIPQPGNALDVTFRSQRALARGEPIRLHLHNHGRNDWLLVGLHVLGEPM